MVLKIMVFTSLVSPKTARRFGIFALNLQGPDWGKDGPARKLLPQLGGGRLSARKWIKEF
jgi:hypothetical protein